MSNKTSNTLFDATLFDTTLKEARRQAEICNACRYCEGYCQVFPSMFEKRVFGDGDLTQLANLCHNCRGCYYACQYIPPHEFALNLPKALAETRHESWKKFALPHRFAHAFERSGLLMGILMVLCLMLFFWVATFFRPANGAGFYAILSHSMMIAIFIPAFLLPFFSIFYSLTRYWHYVGGGAFHIRGLWLACWQAATMNNLSGGHGHGCNFEDGDRYSNARRYYHQASLYGFLLCFISTISGTILHYGFGLEAPYAVFSVPKLTGISGGVLLCIGCLGLAWLKSKADREQAVSRIWGGEMAFVMLLFLTSASGLALYAATQTIHVEWLLPLHLACVLTFFLTTPYSKMVHGFYRMTALIIDAQKNDG